jgi:hypothetical protein
MGKGHACKLSRCGRRHVSVPADAGTGAAGLKWLHSYRSPTMTQHAIIRGEVCFRPGDGMPIEIPDGPVDIEVAADSVTLSWQDGERNASSAAITRDEYQRYVKEGKIRVTG